MITRSCRRGQQEASFEEVAFGRFLRINSKLLEKLKTCQPKILRISRPACEQYWRFSLYWPGRILFQFRFCWLETPLCQPCGWLFQPEMWIVECSWYQVHIIQRLGWEQDATSHTNLVCLGQTALCGQKLENTRLWCQSQTWFSSISGENELVEQYMRCFSDRLFNHQVKRCNYTLCKMETCCDSENVSL